MLTRLRIEQTRLLNWGDQVGLLEASLETTSISLGLNRNLIHDVLLEIQAAFRGCVDIQARFDPVTKSSHLSPQPKPTQQRALKRKALLERVLDIPDKSFRAATRLQWAAIKKDSFEKLVGKLIMLNDRVESLLDRNALGELQNMQVQSNLMLLQVTDEVTKLRLLVEALKINRNPGDQNAYRKVSSRDSIDQGSPESTVASLAQFKSEASLLIQDTTRQIPSRIDLSHVALESGDCGTSRSLGWYGGHDIWLEWREQMEDGQFSYETRLIIDRRVKQLATLLSIKDKPPLFKAPFCIGYVYDDRDESRHYALAYKIEIPPHSKYLGMCTLRDILDTNPVPSLDKRLGLASALADSLFYLHAVSWLHKGIRSDNVLFMRYQSATTNLRADDSTMADLNSPIMSGFDYSRPDLVDEQSFRNTRTPSHDLYSHPDLLQFRTRRSRKCHDMYSLGLILVEIALWRPIEDIVGIEVRRSQLLQISQAMARLPESENSLGSELAARVGDRYLEVVKSCVSSENDNGPAAAGSKEDDPDFAAEMQESFFEKVVLKLRRLRQLSL